jgi:DNA-binding MarR family transcriptional regulator
MKLIYENDRKHTLQFGTGIYRDEGDFSNDLFVKLAIPEKYAAEIIRSMQEKELITVHTNASQTISKKVSALYQVSLTPKGRKYAEGIQSYIQIKSPPVNKTKEKEPDNNWPLKSKTLMHIVLFIIGPLAVYISTQVKEQKDNATIKNMILKSPMVKEIMESNVSKPENKDTVDNSIDSSVINPQDSGR